MSPEDADATTDGPGLGHGQEPQERLLPTGVPLILFGGSFNPFHNGHLRMCRAALEARPAAHLVLLPAGRPPHKAIPGLLPYEHRLAMLGAVARELGPRVHVSRLESDAVRRAELDRPTGELPPSYTCETLRRVRRRTDQPLSFLIGADSLRDLSKWARVPEILELAELLIIERPEVDTEAAFAGLSGFLPEPRIAELRRGLVAMAPHPASSTKIRALAAAGEAPDALDCPPAVRDYLTAHGLLDQLSAG